MAQVTRGPPHDTLDKAMLILTTMVDGGGKRRPGRGAETRVPWNSRHGHRQDTRCHWARGVHGGQALDLGARPKVLAHGRRVRP